MFSKTRRPRLSELPPIAVFPLSSGPRPADQQARSTDLQSALTQLQQASQSCRVTA
ncbi:hypothetical protein [Deinococcus ruber]|uniref:hypothetical protein n=1 Tax=Deinococcus ruber TaxID=1848197 RepID=UPI001663A87E|nr:hypothetical protein [Deinococcus ruber]